MPNPQVARKKSYLKLVEDRPQGTLLKKAYINTEVAQEHSGIEYAEAVKTALPMVVFE